MIVNKVIKNCVMKSYLICYSANFLFEINNDSLVLKTKKKLKQIGFNIVEEKIILYILNLDKNQIEK